MPLPNDDVMMAEDDDDLPPMPGRTPQAATPIYPGSVQGSYPADTRVERAPLPDRYNSPAPQPYVPGQQASPGYQPVPAPYPAQNPYGQQGAPVYGERAPAGGYGAQRPDYDPVMRPPAAIDANRGPMPTDPNRPTVGIPSAPANIGALPPEEQPEVGEPKELPPQFKRQLVDYLTKEPAGTIIIDTPTTYLYLVLGNGKALRYGIGVGRDGFTWAGTERITKVAEWPDWYPPAEMIERQPYLPRMMAGGPGNPLGARALYLGKTVYRIHGTNQPSTIGKFVSSGCIRMINEDVEDLYGRVKVGTRVVVLPSAAPAPSASVASPMAGAATATR
jgi:lipoprotein-anchoring transpeptidase ErfK/SrfK